MLGLLWGCGPDDWDVERVNCESRSLISADRQELTPVIGGAFVLPGGPSTAASTGQRTCSCAELTFATSCRHPAACPNARCGARCADNDPLRSL